MALAGFYLAKGQKATPISISTTTSAISATERLAFLAMRAEHVCVGQCWRWHCSNRSASIVDTASIRHARTD